MEYKIVVKKAREVNSEDYVIAPQHSTGLLLVRPVDKIERIDDGKWIEITTDDGRKHLVSPKDRIFVLY